TRCLRGAIASESSDFSASVPRPVQADALVLTPLGATLDVRGSWESVAGANLRSWKHRTSIGRDDFVQATLTGFLFPFGHRAIAVETVQRAQNGQWATLSTEWRVELLDTQRDFSPRTRPVPYAHRAMPFQSVRVQQTSFAIDAPPAASLP